MSMALWLLWKPEAIPGINTNDPITAIKTVCEDMRRLVTMVFHSFIWGRSVEEVIL